MRGSDAETAPASALPPRPSSARYDSGRSPAERCSHGAKACASHSATTSGGVLAFVGRILQRRKRDEQRWRVLVGRRRARHGQCLRSRRSTHWLPTHRRQRGRLRNPGTGQGRTTWTQCTHRFLPGRRDLFHRGTRRYWSLPSPRPRSRPVRCAACPSCSNTTALTRPCVTTICLTSAPRRTRPLAFRSPVASFCAKRAGPPTG
jgi:hypothetical protein